MKQIAMRFFRNFTCNDQLNFYQPLLYLSCYRWITRYGPAKPKPSCSNVCSSVKAKSASFDDWNSLNLSFLHESCKEENTKVNKEPLKKLTTPGNMTRTHQYHHDLVHKTCDFTVSIDYDFTKSIWHADDRPISNLTWKSSFYPRLNDLVVICDLKFSLTPGSMPAGTFYDIPRYCVSSSTIFDFERTNYVDHQDLDEKPIHKF